MRFSSKISLFACFGTIIPTVNGIIDEVNHTISLIVPFGTDVKSLVPTITVSEKSSVVPNSGTAVDFTNPVTFTVTAEDGSTQDYIATVLISSPLPDTEPPSIISYSLNGVSGDISIIPSSENPVTIILTASENVDWTSLKIDLNAITYACFF